MLPLPLMLPQPLQLTLPQPMQLRCR